LVEIDQSHRHSAKFAPVVDSTPSVVVYGEYGEFRVQP
jgi:hypothetical protein